jgi:hypothetical protein
MFGWFRKKTEVKTDNLEILDFQMEEGVECLLEKVLESVRHNFYLWKIENQAFKRMSELERDNIIVQIYTYWGGRWSGTLKIDDAIFSLNDGASRKFLAVWEEVEHNKQNWKNEAVLKQWGCK